MLSVSDGRLTHLSKSFFVTEYRIFFFSPLYVLSLFNSYKSTNSPVCEDSVTSLACFCSALFLFGCALTPLYLPEVRDGLFTNHCLVLKCHLFGILSSSWVGHKMNLVRYYDLGLATKICGWNLHLEEDRNQIEVTKPGSETERRGVESERVDWEKLATFQTRR